VPSSRYRTSGDRPRPSQAPRRRCDDARARVARAGNLCRPSVVRVSTALDRSAPSGAASAHEWSRTLSEWPTRAVSKPTSRRALPRSRHVDARCLEADESAAVSQRLEATPRVELVDRNDHSRRLDARVTQAETFQALGPIRPHHSAGHVPCSRYRTSAGCPRTAQAETLQANVRCSRCIGRGRFAAAFTGIGAVASFGRNLCAPRS
jgi:hypothetical protein